MQKSPQSRALFIHAATNKVRLAPIILKLELSCMSASPKHVEPIWLNRRNHDTYKHSLAVPAVVAAVNG